MKKDSVVIFIKNGYAEVDWLLPVLQKLKKKYSILFFFSSKKSHDVLKKNKFIYSEFKKIRDEEYIQKKSDFIILRFLRKIIIRFSYLERCTNYLNSKIHDINFIKKLFNNYNIKSIFSEFDYLNPWLRTVDQSKINIFHYPSTPKIFPKYKRNKFFPRHNLLGKYLILNSSRDLLFWRKKNINKKILISGYPKYDRSWMKKSFNLKVVNKKKNKILFPYNYNLSKYDFNDQKKIKLYLKKIIEIILNKTKYELTVKPHPRADTSYLFQLIKKFNNKRIKVTNQHLFKLLKETKFCLFEPESSVVLDALAMKVPPLQLFINHLIKKNIDLVIYDKLGLSVNLRNFKYFEKLIQNKNRIRAMGNKNVLNFYRYYKKNQNDALKIANIIIRINAK